MAFICFPNHQVKESVMYFTNISRKEKAATAYGPNVAALPLSTFEFTTPFADRYTFYTLETTAKVATTETSQSSGNPKPPCITMGFCMLRGNISSFSNACITTVVCNIERYNSPSSTPILGNRRELASGVGHSSSSANGSGIRSAASPFNGVMPRWLTLLNYRLPITALARILN